MGIEVLGPDVNESRDVFTPVFAKGQGAPMPNAQRSIPNDQARSADSLGIGNSSLVIPPPHGGGRIRFGLAGIKGVGEQAAQKIIEEREANGPFKDFADFTARVDARALNKRVLEHLVKTGAFDFSGANAERKEHFLAWGAGSIGYLLISFVGQAVQRANDEQ